MSKHAWYIDSLDPLAGRAFASLRGEILLTADRLDDFGPSVFISPPTFAPEPVSGASLGFSATRGSFQAGVFDTQGEIPFPSSASVAEFVRRTYLCGGGGATPGDGGVPVPPNKGSPLEGPEGAAPPEDEGPTTLYAPADTRERATAAANAEKAEKLFMRVHHIAAGFENFANNVHRGHPQSSSDLEKTGAPPPPPKPANFSERLARAGGLLVIDLLGRVPDPHNPTAWYPWVASFRALLALLMRMRIVDWLLAEPRGGQLGGKILLALIRKVGSLTNPRALLDPLYQFVPELEFFASHPMTGEVRRRLSESGRDGDYIRNFVDFLEREYHHDLTYRSYWRRCCRPVFLLPRDFHRIPVPEWVAEAMDFGEKVQGRPDLLHFLLLALGNPATIHAGRDPIADAAREDLLLFVAAAVVSQPDSHYQDHPGIFYPAWSDAIRADLAWYHAELCAEALAWILRGLPKQVFAAETETILLAARRCAYA